MKTFSSVQTSVSSLLCNLIGILVCIMLSVLIILNIYYITLSLIPIKYNYQNVDEPLHLMKYYRFYYTGSDTYIKDFNHTISINNCNRFNKGYNCFKINSV